MLGIALIALVLLAIWFLQGERSSIRRNGKRLPRAPGTLPFAGNGFWFLKPRYQLLDWFATIGHQVGFDTYEISVPSLPPAIVVNSPENVEHVLKNNDLFIKGDFFRSRSWDLFGNGIINADGALWKVQRKAGLRFFSNANLKLFIDDILPPILEDTTRILDQAANSGEVVDLQHVLLELTTRLMGKVAYDMDMHGSLPFSKAFDFASGKITDRLINPFWKLSESLFGTRLRKALEDVKSFGRTIVADSVQKRKDPTKSPSQIPAIRDDQLLHTNLINALLDNIDDHQVVADAAMNFLSAGRDTTAQSMTWAFYSLMRHPEALTPLLDELSSFGPSHGNHNDNNNNNTLLLPYDTLQNPSSIPYTSALFAETLRLYPPVPFELKESVAPSTFPDGTFLPANSVVLWIPWSLGRSPLIWGPDAADFRPQRWILPGGKEKGVEGEGEGGASSTPRMLTRTAYENPVFNAGPRTCLGKRMAEALGAKVIAALVWEFEFEEVRDERRGGLGIGKERVSQNSLTLPMEGGLPCYVKRRRSICDHS